MAFTLVDVILIIVLFGFIAGGFALGLIRAVGAIVGLVLGTWVAGHYFQPVAAWLTPILMGHDIAASIIAFLLIFIVVNRLVVLVFHLLDRVFHLIAIIPFLKSLNRLGGMILGAAEGLLTIGIVLYIIAKFAPDSGFVLNDLNNSQVAHWLVASAQWLTTLLPTAFNQIKTIF